MTRFPLPLLLVLALPFLEALSPAQNVVSNLTNTSSGSVTLGTTGASLAQAIQNDPIELQLGRVVLKLSSASGTAAARVKLWTSIGTTPELLVEDLGVISNITSATPTDFTVVSTLKPDLNVATRYWISVTNEDGAGQLVWSFTTDLASEGLATFSSLLANSTDGSTWGSEDNSAGRRLLLTIEPHLLPFQVANNQNTGPGSLPWAVVNANTVPGPQTITFAPALAGATITLEGSHMEVSSVMTVDGSALATKVSVSGNADANALLDEDESRLFDVTAPANLTLRGLILRDGQRENTDETVGPISWGGAIRNAGTLALENCEVLNCRARFGGAIHSTGPLTMTNVQVLNCFAQAKIGNEENPNASVEANGGAVYSAGPTTLTNCRLDNNSATYGGGIWKGPTGTLTLTDCSISSNTGLFGGGLWCEPSTVTTATRCSFVANQALTSGGGIYNDAADVTLTQCTIAGNSATSIGGGLFVVSPGSTDLTHVTVARNTAGSNGGGIFTNIGTSLTVRMSLLGNNTRSPAGVTSNDDIVGNWTAPSDTVNLVRAHNLGTRTGPAPISADPVISLPGNYGGLGRTVALLTGSPAINAASGSTITSDQRGQPVIGTPDLGAFETDPVIDASHGTIAIQQSPFSILEEAGTAQVTFVRTGGSLGPVTVTANSLFETATAEDFTPVANQVISFAHGQTVASLPVTLVSDPDLREPNETFLLTLSNATGGAVLGTPNPAVVRIVDFFDRTSPSLTLLTPASNVIILEADGPVVNVTGSARDNLGIEKVEISLNNGAFVPAVLTHAVDYLSCEYALALTVPPGKHSLAVRATDTRGRLSPLIRRTFTYRVERTLGVSINGSGSVSRGFAPSSTRFVGIPYSITATPLTGFVFNGWTANTFAGTGVTPAAQELPTLPFIMQDGLVLTANFIANPFVPEIIGRFDGLVLPDNATTPASTNTGFLSTTVTNRGGFTARLTLDGSTHTLTGVFTNQGAVRFGKTRLPLQVITRRNKPTLEVALAYDMTVGDPMITGTVTQKDNLGAVVAVSEITSKRSAYSTTAKVDPALAGTSLQRYNFILPAKAQPAPLDDLAKTPQGTGIGSLTLRNNGSTSVAFHLADNTKFTFSTVLSKDNDCPVFGQLYSKLGSFAALISINPTLANTDATALNCLWFRPAQTTSQWYPQGWPGGISLDLFASKFVIPTGSSVFPGLGADDFVNGNADLTFTGGLLNPSPLAKALNITTANAVANAPATDKTYTARLTRTTGEWTGTFTHTDTRRTAWQATTFQKAGTHQGAHGFFLTVAPKPVNGQGQSGHVSIEAD